MAKSKFRFSLSGALYDLGSRIQFAPSFAFAASRTEKEKDVSKIEQRLLPYKKKVKTALSKMSEQSAILELLRRFVKYIFTLRIRSLGIFFFLCGFIRIAAYFVTPFVSLKSDPAGHLLFGVAQIFLALLCSFSRGDVADSLKKSLFFRGILKRLFGIKEWQISGGKSKDRGAVMFLAGLGFGVLSLFVPTAFLAKAVLIVAVVLFVFYSPEAGLVMSILAAVLSDVPTLPVLLLLTLVSFFFKCSVGKRSLIVSPMDPAVLLFVLPFLQTSVKEDGVGFFSLFFLYALVACLVRTVASVMRVLFSVTAVSFVLSLFVSARSCLERFFPAWFARVEGLDEFFFVKPNVVTGLIIAMSVPVMMGMMKGKMPFGKRFVRFLSLAVHLTGLFLIGDRNVWLAAILGMMVYVAFSFRSGLLFLTMTGLAAVSVLRILPFGVAMKLLGFFGVRSELSSVAARSSGESLLEYFYRGGGGFWIFALVLLFGFFLYEIVLFCLKTTNPRLHSVVFGSVCAVVVFFAASLQTVELDYRIIALFLLHVSLPRAARRAALREEVRLPY
jgi:hypothetical protein